MAGRKRCKERECKERERKSYEGNRDEKTEKVNEWRNEWTNTERFISDNERKRIKQDHLYHTMKHF